MSGTQDVVVAAGVESMSRVPMGTPVGLAAEAGIGVGPWSERIRRRYGVDDFSQFVGADMVAAKYGLTRDQLDAYALESHRRAGHATDVGAFDREILPIEITGADGSVSYHRRDEGIRADASLEAIGSVRLLRKGGYHSAASASQMCDGASGLLVVSERALKTHGLTPIARVHAMAVTAGDPVIMLDEPVPATERGPEARRVAARRHRSLRDQRSLRGDSPRLAAGDAGRPRTPSTSTAAASRSAIRSAPPAPS